MAICGEKYCCSIDIGVTVISLKDDCNKRKYQPLYAVPIRYRVCGYLQYLFSSRLLKSSVSDYSSCLPFFVRFCDVCGYTSHDWHWIAFFGVFLICWIMPSIAQLWDWLICADKAEGMDWQYCLVLPRCCVAPMVFLFSWLAIREMLGPNAKWHLSSKLLFLGCLYEGMPDLRQWVVWSLLLLNYVLWCLLAAT